MTPVALNVAPHPDDELLGAPATLLALREAGWRVVNFACSLGRPPEVPRRRAELEEACRRAGFELAVAGDPSEAALVEELGSLVCSLAPKVVLAPSPHDRHPTHEAAGRAAVAACEAAAGAAHRGTSTPGRAPRLWLWGLWAELAFPTLLVAFGEERLQEVCWALEAHVGELERNDYRRALRGRAMANACLGPERVFGFGTSPGGAPYAEPLLEAGLSGGCWLAGRPRWLDPSHPLPDLGRRDLGGWLRSPSPYSGWPAGI